MSSAARGAAALVIAAGLGACMPSSGTRWVEELPESAPVRRGEDAWRGADPASSARRPDDAAYPMLDPGASVAQEPGDDARIVIEASSGEIFRNTYYDFPSEGAGARDATIYDAACAPIAKVTRDFHDRVCVQGSGRLAAGPTVSFAKRDCACADACPRTGQKICYERLDPARFPSGRGAMGRPITPLRTVAVDPAVIPLGTTILIPELAGIPRPDGTLHDGCFVAEDRGIRVVGRQVDVFTGDPAITARWNQLFPSNKGVHVRRNDPRCASR